MTNRTDSFDRADNNTTLGTPSDAGSDWVAHVGTWGISGNLGYNVDGGTHTIATLESSVSDVEVQFTGTVGTGEPQSVARLADASNYILLQTKPTTVTIFKRVAGGFTQLAQGGITFAANDVWKLRCDSADLLTAYQNGVSKCSATDTAGSNNTKHGISALGDTSIQFNDFSITEIVAGGDANRIFFPYGMDGTGGGVVGGNRIH